MTLRSNTYKRHSEMLLKMHRYEVLQFILKIHYFYIIIYVLSINNILLHFWLSVIPFPFYLETAVRKSSSSASHEDKVEKRESQLASDLPNGN